MNRLLVVVVVLCAAWIVNANASTPTPVPAHSLDVRVARLEAVVACMKTRGVVVQGDVVFVEWRTTPACLKRIGGTP